MPMRVLRQCLLLALYLYRGEKMSALLSCWLASTFLRSPFVLVGIGGECDEPDGVAGPEADPLGDGAVLLLRLRKLLLGAERLLAL